MTLFAFKLVSATHNALLTTSVQLLETVGKVLFRNHVLNSCHTILNLETYGFRRGCGTNRERTSNLFKLIFMGQEVGSRRVLLMTAYSAVDRRVDHRPFASNTRTQSMHSTVSCFRMAGPPTRARKPVGHTFSAHSIPPIHLHQHFTGFRRNFSQFGVETNVDPWRLFDAYTSEHSFEANAAIRH